MNLLNIFSEIEKVDPEFSGRMDSRRDAIKNITSFGSKVAVAAIPFALGTMFKKAYGAAGDRTALDVLNFALTLEYLESAFYDTAYATGGLIPATDKNGIKVIMDDEDAHVVFLTNAIKAAGGTPVVFDKKKDFDFTAKGTFPTVCKDYNVFLAVAQTFEDTGVRAYKGQAGYLLGTGAILTAALSIHSVEARHAAHVRGLRQAKGANVKPWITGKDSGIGAVVQASYDGEETVNQLGVDITMLKDEKGNNINNAIATESFDEPLGTEQVLAIVAPFFKK